MCTSLLLPQTTSDDAQACVACVHVGMRVHVSHMQCMEPGSKHAEGDTPHTSTVYFDLSSSAQKAIYTQSGRHKQTTQTENERCRLSALKSISQGCWWSEAAHVDALRPPTPNRNMRPRHKRRTAANTRHEKPFYVLNASANTLRRSDNLSHGQGPLAFLGLDSIPFCFSVYSGKSSPLTSGVFPPPRKVGSRGMPLRLSADKTTAATDRCPPFTCFGCFSFLPRKYSLSKHSVGPVDASQSQDFHFRQTLGSFWSLYGLYCLKCSSFILPSLWSVWGFFWLQQRHSKKKKKDKSLNSFVI